MYSCFQGTYVLFPDIFSHSVQRFRSVSVVYDKENYHMVFYRRLPDLMFVFGVFVIASLESKLQLGCIISVFTEAWPIVYCFFSQ